MANLPVVAQDLIDLACIFITCFKRPTPVPGLLI